MATRQDMLRTLDWQVRAGATDALGETPVDRYAASARPPATAPKTAATPLPAQTLPPAAKKPAAMTPVSRAPSVQPGLRPPEAAADDARAAAAAADSLDGLRRAIAAFEGCGLKATARNTVVSDGVDGAPVMVIGEAPGADEDRQGLPFVGRAGQLLDRMLAAIGMSREKDAYITNMVFWRPPGNRNPTTQEIATCLPFVERHIDLATPRILVPVGAAAARALLGTSEGISRLRGRWKSYRTPAMAEAGTEGVPVMATYHPAYLLRQPAHKKAAWQDLLLIRARLDDLADGSTHDATDGTTAE